VRSTQTRLAEFRLSVAAGAASLRFGILQAFAAWPVLMGRGLFFIVIMSVLSALWDRVQNAHLPHTLAVALPPGGLALYVGATEWITLSIAAIHLRLEDDIRTGSLEPHLLRPKSYLLQKVAESFGGTLARLFAIGVAALLALAVSGRAVPSFLAFSFAALLGVLGSAIGVLLFALVGLCAFWMRRVLPPFLVMQKTMFLLGGLFAPISLYPAWLFRYAVLTPFAANIYFTGEQMLTPSSTLFARALGLEVFWLVVLSAFLGLIWKLGIGRVLREGLP
jgi:ABC-type uncharacterized transport system permease subunit